MKKIISAVMAVLLAGCSSYPTKAPVCNGAHKRPVNMAQQQNTTVNPTSYTNCA